AEGRSKRIDLAQSHGCGFYIKLTRLREECLLVKIIDREQCGGSFAGGGRKNRWIGEGKAAIVKEISSRTDDLSTHPQNCRLPRSADPEMAIFHQKIRTVLFASDWEWVILRHALNDFHVAYVEFVAARRAF